MAEPYVCINSHASFMSPPRAPAAPLPIHQTAQAVMSSSNKPPFIFPSHQPLLLPLLLTFTHSSPFSLLPPFFFLSPCSHLTSRLPAPSPPLLLFRLSSTSSLSSSVSLVSWFLQTIRVVFLLILLSHSDCWLFFLLLASAQTVAIHFVCSKMLNE